MLIFKVMVCFLAVFTGEDYVGGLPTIQDSPDNHRAGQSARSASNQGVANESAASPPTKVLDYAERHEEEVRREVNPEIKIAGINPVKISSAEFERESSSFVSSRKKDQRADDQLLEFRMEEPVRKDENILGDVSQRGSPPTDQFLDKSKSRNDQAPSSELPITSHGAQESQRFSSVYAKMDLDEKVNKKKLEFKNDLSAYLTDVLDTVVSGEPSKTTRNSTGESKSPANEAGGNLLSRKKNAPMPEEESKISTLENRQRKSVGDVVTWHQQSTNMRPTRTQHLVQNKRSPKEGNVLKLPGYGGRRLVARNPTSISRGSNRRHFTAPDGLSSSSSSSRGGNQQLQFSGLNPLQINAAMAYSNRQPEAQALNIDLSRALYQFGPAQLHALRGVFDKVPPSSQNFKPIAPKQVAYVPPRIVYETKIVPTPFMPFRTEQKTVEALSALLGQNPAQQLEGLNLILRKDRPRKIEAKIPVPPTPLPEISRQGIHEPVALGQAFVTPIPSIDINSGLIEGGFRFSQEVRDPEEILERPLDQKTPEYRIPENIAHRENPYKTIPIVEEPEEAQPGQTVLQKEPHPVWTGVQEVLETTRGENEVRYSQHNEQGKDHGDAYAANYSFGYHVKDYESGNNFGHQETRNGVITNGAYHVLLPDGRLQNVNYHVDEGGYHAKVSYQSNHSA